MLEREEIIDRSSIVVVVSHCKGETRRDVSRKSTKEELMVVQNQMVNDHDRLLHLNTGHPCDKKYYVV